MEYRFEYNAELERQHREQLREIAKTLADASAKVEAQRIHLKDSYWHGQAANVFFVSCSDYVSAMEALGDRLLELDFALGKAGVSMRNTWTAIEQQVARNADAP